MLLEMRHIDKAFSGVYALKDVSFALEAGEIHGLVGENGAGKSTLIKLLTGVYSLTAGEILWEGKPYTAKTPEQARAAGISVIHQDRTLIPEFDAVENAWLGLRYPTRCGKIDWKTMRGTVSDKAEELGIEVALNALAREMSPPQRTNLEIVRAMLTDSRLLILDEPTAALTDRESERLFDLMARLKARGTAILYVSHRLDEVLRLTDRVTVLRNGENAGTLITSETDRRALISAMTEEFEVTAPPKRQASGEVCLMAEGLVSRDGAVRGADICLRAGEILGLFGLGGSGRTEILECLYGLKALSQGEIALFGERQGRMTPTKALQQGVALIPEDRLGEALVRGLSVRENVLLSDLERYATAGVVRERDARIASDGMTEKIGVRMADPEMPVNQLSGGNQQKVVFSRALMNAPKVLLADEPTQAVDVRTRAEIHRLLRTLAEEGAAVLFVSSDIQEVLELSDRIQIVSRGKTGETLQNDGLTQTDLLTRCYAD